MQVSLLHRQVADLQPNRIARTLQVLPRNSSPFLHTCACFFQESCPNAWIIAASSLLILISGLACFLNLLVFACCSEATEETIYKLDPQSGLHNLIRIWTSHIGWRALRLKQSNWIAATRIPFEGVTASGQLRFPCCSARPGPDCKKHELLHQRGSRRRCLCCLSLSGVAC